jgi:thimet oligopeptidase
MLSWAWPIVPWPGGVEQDFLEVPSMALEKFACEPLLLQRVAGHFSGQGQLEEAVVAKIKQYLGWMKGMRS